MNPDAAATSLLNYEAIGAMLVLTVLAIMWLANVFKKTTEAHTEKILEITAANAKQIEDKDAKHDAQMSKLIGDFTAERKETAMSHAQERREMIEALNGNTKILNDLYRVIEKRGRIESSSVSS